MSQQHIQAFDQVHVQANPQPTQVFVNSQPTNPYLTRANLVNEVEFLRSEIEALRIENKMLKEENVLIKEELETFKNPGTSPLKLVLKYPTSQRKDQEANGQPKKRKTLPFARLLTSDQSWQEIKEAEELVNKKAEDVKRRKEEAALKHTNRELEKAQNKKLESKKNKNERKKIMLV
ncbi:23467_t:CDS:1, partial [Gigaspora rosea]